MTPEELAAARIAWKEADEQDFAEDTEHEDNDKDLMIAIAASRQSLRAYELSGGNSK